MKYLRVWLEDHDAAYVLATKRNDTLITEPPWVWWRPVLWDFDRDVVVSVGSVERLLILGWRAVGEVAV